MLLRDLKAYGGGGEMGGVPENGNPLGEVFQVGGCWGLKRGSLRGKGLADAEGFSIEGESNKKSSFF